MVSNCAMKTAQFQNDSKMPQMLIVSCILLVVSSPKQTAASIKGPPYDKNGEIAYMNIQESAPGFELNGDKNEFLVSNSTVESDVDCELKCLDKQNCLSGMSVKLANESFRCLLFNRSSTDFEKRLTQRNDTMSFQLVVRLSFN